MKNTNRWLRIVLRNAGVILGLFAVLAAGVYFVLFPKVQMQSEDLSIDTFQIEAAAVQYFRHSAPDRIFVLYDELIGPGSPYLSRTNTFGGADYHEMFPVRRWQEEYAVTMGDGRQVIVLFLYPPQKDKRCIMLRRTADGRIVPVKSEKQFADDVAIYQRWLEKEKNVGALKKVRFKSGRWFEIAYRDGVPHGPFKAFYANGGLWGEANYENGRPVGWHRIFDREGKVIYETEFLGVRAGDGAQ